MTPSGFGAAPTPAARARRRGSGLAVELVETASHAHEDVVADRVLGQNLTELRVREHGEREVGGGGHGRVTRRGPAMSALPTACVLIIGNEILSGKTQDTNLQFLGFELAKLGITLSIVAQ